MKENIKKILGELIGSMFISFLGLILIIPFVVTGELSNMYEFAVWFGLAFAITVIIFAPISGVHVNPGVTLAWAIFGGFNWKLVPGYIIAQIIGWGLGIVPIFLIYGNTLAEWAIETSGNPATLFFCSTAAENLLAGAGLEIAMTLLLTYTIFVFTDKRFPNLPSPALFPFAIGIVISVIIAISGGFTGACINTARDLGPRIVGYIYGTIKGYDVSSIFSNYQWLMYVLAPITGAILGGILHRITVKLLPSENNENETKSKKRKK